MCRARAAFDFDVDAERLELGNYRGRESDTPLVVCRFPRDG